MDNRFSTIKLRGVAASAGLACGISFIHYEKLTRVRQERIQSSQVRAEIRRLNRALAKTTSELEVLRNEARSSVGTELSKIFDAELMILEDADFMTKVKQAVVAKLQNVEYLFQQEVNKTVRSLSRSKDEYMREMISDINSVSARLLHNLSGFEDIKLRRTRTPIIAFAPFFSPGEIISMRKANVAAFVAETGGPTSHMVLFAKALGLPAVVGVKGCLDRVRSSQQVLVDGNKGEVTISPPTEDWKAFKKKVDSLKRRERRHFASIGDIPSATIDGHRVEIQANLEVPTEYDEKLAGENVGVGLYRTEFLYLNSGSFPDEEAQYAVYSKIAEQFRSQTVTLRTFDLGGDKFTEHFRNEGEANPALGWRAIRFSLDVPKIFRAQLRAMLRASVHGNIRIMLPMISSLEQVVRAKRALSGVKRDLTRRGVPFDQSTQLGIMIEIPSAAIMAYRLALEVDFFSIGTNDLTQYALAVDRGNAKVAKWYRELHPAVLRLIAMAVDAGHEHHLPVSLCGELAGNPIATKMLVGFGIDSLSMSPNSIHSVKALLPQMSFEESRQFSRRVLTMSSVAEIESFLGEDYEKIR
ncbi:MAG: phosphoenolpyruvate--protein phosphotransferase [candidate division Zixibacteria bacterium]|nr:phosphoenolpyruvate--protein phosphotransferase [candidate division Zixibacteria bacterium]